MVSMPIILFNYDVLQLIKLFHVAISPIILSSGKSHCAMRDNEEVNLPSDSKLHPCPGKKYSNRICILFVKKCDYLKTNTGLLANLYRVSGYHR